MDKTVVRRVIENLTEWCSTDGQLCAELRERFAVSEATAQGWLNDYREGRL